MHELDWNAQRSPSYAAAKRRTARDVVGTAYWTTSGAKHFLYVKVREDKWLCFAGQSISACLTQYARTPGRGGPATDHLIANGISATPGKPSMLRATQLASAKKPAKPPRLSATLTPDELWRAVEARGAQVVRRTVSNKELAAAETSLRFRFPRSYSELVLRHGAPAIGRNPKAPADELAFAVLTPREVVQLTKQLRELDADMFEDPASLARVRAQLANAVMFQLGRDAGEGYVFLVDTARRGGEPRIAGYHHDYLEELDWRATSKVVFRSLSASTLDVARQIADDLP